MVGGDDEQAIERAEPVLNVLGERLFRTGPLGSGHAMKALNNYCGAAAYAATAEALAIGQQFGLRGEIMLDVLNASTGRSFNTEVVFKDEVVPGRYATGFALALLAKDVGIAASLAEASGLEAPVCELVSGRWSQALDALRPDADHSEAHKAWWERRARRRRSAAASVEDPAEAAGPTSRRCEDVLSGCDRLNDRHQTGARLSGDPRAHPQRRLRTGLPRRDRRARGGVRGLRAAGARGDPSPGGRGPRDLPAERRRAGGAGRSRDCSTRR